MHKNVRLTTILLLVLAAAAGAATNYMSWLGTNSVWTDSANWDKPYNPLVPNYVNIYKTDNDPVIGPGVVTDRYQELKLGVGEITAEAVGLTVAGGTLDMLRSSYGQGNGYLNAGHNRGTNTFVNISDGLISVMQLTVPRLGHGTVNMTGGTMKLDKIHMGHTAGHGEGVINVSGGLINMTDDSSLTQYISIGRCSGAVCSFNVTGGTVNTNLIQIGIAGEGVMNIDGGTVYTSGGLKMAEWGTTGSLNVSGGLLNVTGAGITAGYGSGNGFINISGGAVETTSLTVTTGRVDISGGSLTITSLSGLSINSASEGVNLCGGTLKWQGNRVAAAEYYADDGRITAYGGLGNVVCKYNPAGDYTTVTGGGVLGADFNKDNIVNMLDFAHFADQWLCQTSLGRIKFTVSSAKVASTLTNYPVLITQKSIPKQFWTLVSDSGSNLVFKLADDTVLASEIATLDKKSEIFEAYVTVPMLSSTADTEIYMGFDGSGGSSDSVWDDNFCAVYHMNDDTPICKTATITNLFETEYANQGLAFDGTYFYWGRNLGEYTDGAIYKIDMAGNIEDTFVGPTHSTAGDIREDHDTLLFSNCCGINVRQIWEIDKNTGTKIRSWDITGDKFISGGMIAYKEENTIYMIGAYDGSTDYTIYQIYLFDNGSYTVEDSWGGFVKPGWLTQGMDYYDGHLWFLYDSFEQNHTAKIAQLALSPDGYVITKKVLHTEVPIESEGLAFYGHDLYFGTVNHRMFKVINPLAPKIAEIYDSTEYENDMVKIGFYGVSAISSPAGEAQVFDGQNTYAVCSNPVNVDSLSKFTFEVWAKLDNIDVNNRFFNLSNKLSSGSNDGFAFKPYRSGSNYQMGIWNGSWDYSSVISQPERQYHYFVAAWDGSMVRFYYDGQIAGSASSSGSTGSQLGALCLGGADFGDYFGFDYNEYAAEGAFDEVRISRSQRSLGWIQTTYNNTVSPETFVTAEIE